jgi:hypothetical protein
VGSRIEEGVSTIRIGIVIADRALMWTLVLWVLFSLDPEAVLVEVLVQLISRL